MQSPHTLILWRLKSAPYANGGREWTCFPPSFGGYGMMLELQTKHKDDVKIIKKSSYGG